MKMKKKIIVTALVVCIFVLSIASATIAYFTDTKDITNTFTVGNVAIKLDENKVIQDATTGNYVANGSERTTEGINIPTSLFPKQTISKDPTITNTGSESAYFGAVITIKNGAVGDADVSKMLTFDGDTAAVDDKAVKVNEFLSDLINSGANVTYVKEGGAVKIYIVVDAAQAENDAVVLFKGVNISATWNNKEMANLSDLEITVAAYAVQTAGMTSGSLAALKDAFDVFDALN
jgi:predicted ribosomally synthesized peptide with SipW-like signal peptide